MTCRPLSEVLAEIPAVRQPHGKRYPLHAILTLACAAMLCGDKSYGMGEALWPHLAARGGRHTGNDAVRGDLVPDLLANGLDSARGDVPRRRPRAS